jgi:hypothetical protein
VDPRVAEPVVGTPETRVKGTVIAARIQFVAKRGEQDLRRWIEQLSPAARELVEAGPLVNSWYPFAIFVELTESIDRVFGTGDGQLCRELGRASFDKYSTSVYRLVFRAVTVEFLVRRAKVAWQLHYDAGALESDSESLADGRKLVRIRVRDIPTPHPAHCQSVRGWIVRAAEITGAGEIEERCSRCRRRGDDACEFELIYR